MDAVEVFEGQDLDSLPPVSRPVFIVIVGLPGTGKTFFVKRLTEHLPYIVLESDAIRKKLYPRPNYSPRESAALFRAIHYLIGELLQKGVSVILDATNLSEKNRRPLYRIAEGANARLILVRVEAPEAVVRQRLNARSQRPGSSKSDADWAVYQRMKAEDERITRRHFTVNTARDMTAVIERIVREAGGE